MNIEVHERVLIFLSTFFALMHKCSHHHTPILLPLPPSLPSFRIQSSPRISCNATATTWVTHSPTLMTLWKYSRRYSHLHFSQIVYRSYIRQNPIGSRMGLGGKSSGSKTWTMPCQPCVLEECLPCTRFEPLLLVMHIPLCFDHLETS